MPELAAELRALLAEFDAAELRHHERLAAVAPRHRVGARNLLHAAALQQRPRLVAQLRSIGLLVPQGSTLTRPAVEQLARLLDTEDPGWQPRDLPCVASDSAAVLGPVRPGSATRVMVTLPPETGQDPGLVAGLVEAGMDIARINCARDDPASWAAMAAQVRAAAAAAGRPVQVAMDLPGPKLRTGSLPEGPAMGRARASRSWDGALLSPARLWLTDVHRPTPPPCDDALAVPVPAPWLAAREPGQRIDVRDARGRRRSFTVETAGDSGVLATGGRSAVLTDGTVLQCGEDAVVVRGLPRAAVRLLLRAGDRLVLTGDQAPAVLPEGGSPARIGCTLPEVLAHLRPGHRVLFDDGVIEARVLSTSPGEALLGIERSKPDGHRLGADRGINLPDTALPLPALTARDRELLPVIAAHADLVLVSFLRTPSDVGEVLVELDAAGAAGLAVVLKVETRSGYQQLPELLLEGMAHERTAVLVARGDLAAELAFDQVPGITDHVLSAAAAAGLPTIVATGVLESLVRRGRMSRAEIADAARLLIADCVMLNKGPGAAEAIALLDRLGRP